MGFEVRIDCQSCRVAVEGSSIETWDDEVLLSTRCHVCGDGAPPATREEMRAALDAWGRAEGLRHAGELVEAYFVLPDVEGVLDAFERGERIETTFDVADYLFSGGGAGGTGGEPAVMREEEEKPPSTVRLPQPMSIRKYGTARDELYAIAAIAAADGEASADDLAMLQRAADKRGIPPLTADEIHVRRPTEIDPPPTLNDRERVLEEMFQMAWSDGQMDESEMRVIRGFSRAWGIDPERLREWTELYSFGDSGRFERWFRRIGLFLFPAR
ncbi:MAG: TerB family tellurite resistance protein [Labilithrix sp.]|nr:TerB family tellurite resistance protein [Labilithrix sp.]MCW5815623.1 TerB family tellurite resistance protein [Labilithrix sp.]